MLPLCGKNLPVFIRSSPSLQRFPLTLKTHLFREAFNISFSGVNRQFYQRPWSFVTYGKGALQVVPELSSLLCWSADRPLDDDAPVFGSIRRQCPMEPTIALSTIRRVLSKTLATEAADQHDWVFGTEPAIAPTGRPWTAAWRTFPATQSTWSSLNHI